MNDRIVPFSDGGLGRDEKVVAMSAFRERRQRATAGHVRHPHERELLALARRCGLSVAEIESFFTSGGCG